VFVVERKCGHQRLVPMSARFFRCVAAYVDGERPAETSTDRVLVALKGQRRGEPLAGDGLDKIITNARRRAALSHGTCH
jgi:integrase/recombinase XerD